MFSSGTEPSMRIGTLRVARMPSGSHPPSGCAETSLASAYTSETWFAAPS
jgi:hypothetical protein